MKKKIMILALCVAAVMALGVLFSSFYTVAEDEYAYVIRFSKVEHVESVAGPHLKVPFLDSVITVPKNILLYDLNPSDVLTSDSKAMSVDSYVMWRISDPMTFYRTIGSIAEAQMRLDAATYNALKNIIGTFLQEEIVTQSADDGRNALSEEISDRVKEAVPGYGIEVLDVKIKRFDLPEENEQAVYRRMISDRNQIAEKYRAEGSSEATMMRNNVDKQVNIIVSDATARAEEIKAEGEAEYMRILSAAYDSQDKMDFFAFMRSLEALKKSLSGEEKTVVLGPDSELAKILMKP